MTNAEREHASDQSFAELLDNKLWAAEVALAKAISALTDLQGEHAALTPESTAVVCGWIYNGQAELEAAHRILRFRALKAFE